MINEMDDKRDESKLKWGGHAHWFLSFWNEILWRPKRFLDADICDHRLLNYLELVIWR